MEQHFFQAHFRFKGVGSTWFIHVRADIQLFSLAKSELMQGMRTVNALEYASVLNILKP